MTVKEMLSKLDSREISEWMAYYSMDPFGEVRADYRAAMQCCLLANINRGKGQPFKVSDFMPEFGPKKQQTTEDMKALLMGMAVKHGSH